MPSSRPKSRNGSLSLLLGLILSAIILLLACLHSQNWTAGLSKVSGNLYRKDLGENALGPDGTHSTIQPSSLETVKYHNTAPGLSRRGRPPSAQDDVLREPLWRNQKTDGIEGPDRSKTMQDYREALRRINSPTTNNAAITSLRQIGDWGWVREEEQIMGLLPRGLNVALVGLKIPLEDGWTKATFRHRQKTTHDGKDYPATEAFFAFVTNPKHGIIVVIDSKGPAYREISDTGKKFSSEQVVPVKHISDFLFLEWHSLCQEERVVPTSLRYIVRNGITNGETRNVVREAVDGSLSANLNEWPGKTFAANTDHMQALLGTPNGIAIKHMLAQHRQALGALQLVKILAYKVRPDTASDFVKRGPWLWMLFELNEVAHTYGPRLRRRGSSQSPEASNESIDDLYDSDKGLSDSDADSKQSGVEIGSSSPPRPLDEQTWALQKDDGTEGLDRAEIEQAWDEASDRGRLIEKLWDANSKAGPERSKSWKYNQIQDYGWTREDEHPMLITFSMGIRQAIDELKIPVQGGVGWFKIAFRHTEDSKVGEREYPKTKGFYILTINPRHRIVIVNDARGPDHTKAAQDLEPEQIVPLKHLSDFLYLGWASVCEREGVEPETIKYVLRDHVVNQQTRNVVRHAVDGPLSAKLGEWAGNSFTATTAPEQLRAILGTPNGVAVGWMLGQRSKALGVNRRVVQTVLWKARPEFLATFEVHGPNLYMLFELNYEQAKGFRMQEGSGSKRPGSLSLDAGRAKRPAGPQV